ncbi:MAG: CYTH domain-containing protein [Candidatus Moranbacteria bacterium]|nr:CYTH domain-containing protein [Candidatus Moranbacteria bacterium]
MKKDIEVELRGLLTKEQYDGLNETLSGKVGLKEEKYRILLDYSTFLPGEGIEDRKKDIRVRVTNGVPEIVVKLGSWGGSESRKELSFKGSPGSFDTLVEIFGNLGFTKAVLCERRTKAYDYKGVEFALVEVPGHSYYFEAEKMAHGEADMAEVESEIRAVCEELGLSILTKEDFFKYIDTLNREANAVFEFDSHTENRFRDEFGV